MNLCPKCKKKRLASLKPTAKELKAKAKAEEFWSDPCWAEPLAPVMDRMQIAAHMSKL